MHCYDTTTFIAASDSQCGSAHGIESAFGVLEAVSDDEVMIGEIWNEFAR